jgi:hypothetical protein
MMVTTADKEAFRRAERGDAVFRARSGTGLWLRPALRASLIAIMMKAAMRGFLAGMQK